MQLFTALLSALALISSVTASPAAAVIRRSEDIVFTPQITEPTNGTIWVAGTTQEVMWDTSRIPKSGENYTGTIMLGFDNGTGSENLNYSRFRFGTSPPHSTVRDAVVPCSHVPCLLA